MVVISKPKLSERDVDGEKGTRLIDNPLDVEFPLNFSCKVKFMIVQLASL